MTLKEQKTKLLQKLVPWKLLVCLCFVTEVLSANTLDTGQRNITLELKQVTLQDLFNAIRSQTGMSFVYNADIVKNIRQVSVSAKNESLDEVLNKVFSSTPYDFVLENHSITIVNRPSSGSNSKEYYLISGKVVDDSGQPLHRVSIVVESDKTTTATNEKGEFSIKVPEKEGFLKITFIGMKMQRVKYVVDKELKIVMKEDFAELNKVNVIAYGSRNKREMLGSVSGIKSTDIQNIPSVNLENLIQGRMSGVEVTNVSGSPGGGGSIIAIRGYNSMIDQNTLRMQDYGDPLYVIDGIPVQGFTSPITGTNTLASIDPSTIESIDVLKDAASAAMYGSRAGRGVIIITTKKGQEGKAKFSFNSSYTFSFLPSSPEQTGGRRVRDYVQKAFRNMKRPYEDSRTGAWNFPTSLEQAYGLRNTQAIYDYYWDKALKGAPTDGRNPVNPLIQDSLNTFYNNSTDWFRYAFRVGKILNTNIQASGGSEKMNYMIGCGLYKEEGIAYGSNFSRVNFLSNLNARPVNNLEVDSRFSLTYMNRKTGSSQGGDRIERIPVNPMKTNSFLPGNGEIEKDLLKGVNENVEKNNIIDIKTSLVLNYQILPGLKFSANGSASFNIGARDYFSPSFLSEDKLNTSKFELERSLKFMNEDILSYKKSFKEVHNVDFIAGFSYEKNTMNTNLGVGRGGGSDMVHYIYKYFPELPSADIKTEDKILQHALSNLEEWAMLSYFTRFAYNYDQRYLVELTYRRDGSSIFGDNNKYADFPAVAVGWAFSQEPFMKRAWWLSFGKIRASYGRSGETFPDPYRAHGLLIPGGEFLGRPIMNVDNSMYGGMINRELGWVKHDQYDVGLDMDMFDYRIKMKLDYYYRWSTGVLSSVKLPSTIYPYENQWTNANDVANEGIELELTGDIIRKQNFSWRMRFNASRNWNRLIGTFDGRDVGMPTGIPYHMLGRPLYMIYTFEEGNIFENLNEIPITYNQNGSKNYIYLAQNNYPYGVGMRVRNDINKDGYINYLDQSYQGTTLALVYGGMGHEIKWRNFDLSMLFTYSIGRKMVNMFGVESLDPTEVMKGGNIFMDLSKIKFWEKPGDENIPDVYPELSAHDVTMLQFYPLNSRNVENVSYMKLKQITLGYNFPKEWVKRVCLKNVRIFLTGENIFTLTNYSGPDPETVSLFSGQDNYRNYPLARKVTGGLVINF